MAIAWIGESESAFGSLRCWTTTPGCPTRSSLSAAVEVVGHPIPGCSRIQQIEFAPQPLRVGPLHNGCADHRHRRAPRPRLMGRLQRPRQEAQPDQEAWSEIDVELKRRHDLIPNLVS